MSFIANPAAGRGRTRTTVERYARAVRGDTQFLWTQGPGHARELARQAAGDSDVVCAVGGDGTVSEVVNGLMPRPVPLVVVPSGSGNDFASLVECPRTPEELAEVVARGRGYRLDVLDCGDRWCANSIGIGFEALVTYHSLSIRRVRGLALYLLAVGKALAQYESNHFSIEFDGEFGGELGERRVDGEFLLVSVGNGARAGGGFYINPRAVPDDGRLDVCTADRMPRIRMLSLLPSTIRGRHVGKRGVTVHTAARVRIGASNPFPIHIDGEYLGRRDTPLDVAVIPRALPVLSRAGGRVRLMHQIEQLLG
ncbi:MAG TPA: diacylglycerol kinase family protein [Candidatus Krumholzibacteria bacterium]|nr:diacylglycerol kinase family protein [Candidatus Krumholzibacteria bacterium]